MDLCGYDVVKIVRSSLREYRAGIIPEVWTERASMDGS